MPADQFGPMRPHLVARGEVGLGEARPQRVDQLVHVGIAEIGAAATPTQAVRRCRPSRPTANARSAASTSRQRRCASILDCRDHQLGACRGRLDQVEIGVDQRCDRRGDENHGIGHPGQGSLDDGVLGQAFREHLGEAGDPGRRWPDHRDDLVRCGHEQPSSSRSEPGDGGTATAVQRIDGTAPVPPPLHGAAKVRVGVVTGIDPDAVGLHHVDRRGHRGKDCGVGVEQPEQPLVIQLDCQRMHFGHCCAPSPVADGGGHGREPGQRGIDIAQRA
jgi:hypothetical protein